MSSMKNVRPRKRILMINRNSLYLALFLVIFLVACSDRNEASISINSKPKSILDKFCADCHAPPDPAVHKADEWKNVVFRMQNHRIKRAYGELTEEEFSSVVKYLTDRASQ